MMIMILDPVQATILFVLLLLDLFSLLFIYVCMFCYPPHQLNCPPPQTFLSLAATATICLGLDTY